MNNDVKKERLNVLLGHFEREIKKKKIIPKEILNAKIVVV